MNLVVKIVVGLFIVWGTILSVLMLFIRTVGFVSGRRVLKN